MGNGKQQHRRGSHGSDDQCGGLAIDEMQAELQYAVNPQKSTQCGQ